MDLRLDIQDPSHWAQELCSTPPEDCVEHIVGSSLPSLLDIYTSCCIHKATTIMADPHHHPLQLFTSPPSRRRLCSIRSRSARFFLNFFYFLFLNSLHLWSRRTSFYPTVYLSVYCRVLLSTQQSSTGLNIIEVGFGVMGSTSYGRNSH